MNSKVKNIIYISLTVIACLFVLVSTFTYLYAYSLNFETNIDENLLINVGTKVFGLLLFFGLLFWKFSKKKLTVFVLMTIFYLLAQLSSVLVEANGYDFFGRSTFFESIFFWMNVFGYISYSIAHNVFIIITTIIYVLTRKEK